MTSTHTVFHPSRTNSLTTRSYSAAWSGRLPMGIVPLGMVTGGDRERCTGLGLELPPGLPLHASETSSRAALTRTSCVVTHPLTSRSVEHRGCEAVPAANVGRRGHEAALLPRNGAAESFVSFIPLFNGVVDYSLGHAFRKCHSPVSLRLTVTYVATQHPYIGISHGPNPRYSDRVDVGPRCTTEAPLIRSVSRTLAHTSSASRHRSR
jgi:hypothetical protein